MTMTYIQKDRLRSVPLGFIAAFCLVLVLPLLAGIFVLDYLYSKITGHSL